MSIDEVIEAQTIELPEELTLEEAEELLQHISQTLPGVVSYQPSPHITLIPKTKENQGSTDYGTVNLSGNLRDTKNFGACDCFHFEPSEGDTSKLTKIRFTFVPGWDELSEYRPEVRQLWDDTRKAVMEYFEKD